MVLVQKWPFFQLFFLGNIGQENVFYDILERKNAFLGYKNKKFKKSKSWHFSKGVNPWLWSKNCHFSKFWNRQYSMRKCLLWYFRTKKLFLGYKNKRLKKSKNWNFSKGVNPHGFGPKIAIFPTFFLRQYRQGKWLFWYSRTEKRLSRL